MHNPNVKRHHFILSIWTQGSETAPVWRGSLETAVGECYYFNSFQQLNNLLTQVGWTDYSEADDPHPYQE